MGKNGISAASTVASALIRVTLDNVRVINAANGIVAGFRVGMHIERSMVSNSATAAIVVASGAQMDIDSSAIVNNVLGIQATGKVRVSNSDIAISNTAVSGTVSSYTNNRFSGNDAIGGTISAIGSTSDPTGLQ